MPSQHESPALRVARAHVEAWSKKDWDTARSLLSPDVHVTAMHTGPYPPPTDLTGADDYMKGLAAFAEPIVAGSVRELAGVGDDRNALITLDLQAASTRLARRCRLRVPGFTWSRTARSRPSRSCSTSAKGNCPCHQALQLRWPAFR